MKNRQFNRRRKTSGSAIVVVISLLTVLAIIAGSLMSGKSKRAYFTRYMTNEKRTEAIAEAAIDMLMSSIRADNAAKVNSKSDTDYDQQLATLLRKGVNANNGFSSGGRNRVLTNEYAEGDSITIDSSKIKSAIESMNSESDSIGSIQTLELSANVSHVELFGDSKDEYKVAGINAKVTRPNSEDPLPNRAEIDPSRATWRLPLVFPGEKTVNYSKSIKIPLGIKVGDSGLGIDMANVTIKLDVSRNDNNDSGSHTNLKVTASCTEAAITPCGIEIPDMFGWEELIKDMTQRFLDKKINKNPDVPMPIDLENEYILPFFQKQNSDLTALSIRALQKVAMGDNPSLPAYPDPVKINESIGKTAEKGGLLRIKCRVVYAPTRGGLKDQTIEKTLIAEVPFKVSDCQPIAPDYTFFIANSAKIADSVDLGNYLGSTIALDNVMPQSAGYNDGFVGFENELVLHNLPKGNDNDNNYKPSKAEFYKPTYSGINSDNPAGRVRINGELQPISCFLGVLDKISFTEFNAVCPQQYDNGLISDNSNHPLKVKVTFDIASDKNFGSLKSATPNELKINFPVLFADGSEFLQKAAQEDNGIPRGIIKAFKHLCNMFKGQGNFANIFVMPTLLMGMGHMEYPMSGNIEAHLKMKVSQLAAAIFPDLEGALDLFNIKDPDLDDNSRFWYDIKNVDKTITGNTIWYGMPQTDNSEGNRSLWIDTNKYENMPPFCYSTEQYMKKASEFFESFSEFKEKYNSDPLELNGVIFIKSAENIELDGFSYKGRALIVTDAPSIVINDDITSSDDESFLGLIARKGFIQADNRLINASLFSNAPAVLTKVWIDGNLVVNAFDRDKLHSVHIRYNPSATSYKTASCKMSNAGSGAEENAANRYFVSFADNYLNTWYEKK